MASRGLYTASERLVFAPALLAASQRRQDECTAAHGLYRYAATHKKVYIARVAVTRTFSTKWFNLPAMGLKSRPPDAMGASPCVFVSDPSDRKALGIPSKQPEALTRATRPLATVEIRIDSSKPAAGTGIANGNHCQSPREHCRLQGLHARCTPRNAAADNKQA